MTMIDLEAIRKRNEERKALKAATSKGPWLLDDFRQVAIPYTPNGFGEDGLTRYRAFDMTTGLSAIEVESDELNEDIEADARWIVAAHEGPVEADVDALLAEISRLKEIEWKYEQLCK